MAAVGNLNDYVKFQMAESMTEGGGSGGGLANAAAQLGAGLTMGQQIAAALNTPQSAPAAVIGAGGSGVGGGARASCLARPTWPKSWE